MAKFDKTFPTLDCAACILTPKMVQVGKHPNIKLMSSSEVEEVTGFVGNFKVKVRHKATYVDESSAPAAGSAGNPARPDRFPTTRVMRKGKLIIGTATGARPGQQWPPPHGRPPGGNGWRNRRGASRSGPLLS